MHLERRSTAASNYLSKRKTRTSLWKEPVPDEQTRGGGSGRGAHRPVFEKLERQGYSPEEYKQALEDLIQRGWVEETAREYRLTSSGEAVCELAEEATDRYFYAPWSCLSPAETEILQTLFVKFRNGLLSEA